MALVINKIAKLLVIWGTEKMVKAHIVKCRRRGEGGDMSAKLIVIVLVGAHDNRQGIPANQRTQAPFEIRITGHQWFFFARNGI